MKKIIKHLIIVLIGLFSSHILLAQAVQIGDKLPVWSEGFLDVHFINLK